MTPAAHQTEAMKHYIFPTAADADAFITDLQSQGVVRPEVGTTNYRRAGTVSTPATGYTDPALGTAAPAYVEGSGTAEDAAAGAVKGTGVGAAVGATAGVLGTAGALGAAAATVATGGLALPLILGMTALGAGVGAAVGGVGGAAGVDETGHGEGYDYYEQNDTRYNEVETATNAGGRAVAVDDSVPADVVAAAAGRHNGRLVG